MSTPFRCLPDEDILTAWSTHKALPPFFKSENFPVATADDYPNFCTLANENLFDISTFPMLASRHTTDPELFRLLQPALNLASRIILHKWNTFRPLVRRSYIGGTRQSLVQADIIRTIKRFLPDIKFTDEEQPGIFGVAVNEVHWKLKDELIIDVALLNLLKSPTVTQERKLAAAVYMAVLVCQGLADVLMFRSKRQSVLDESSARHLPGYETPGEKWVEKTLRRIRPVCEGESINALRGLCVKECPSGIAWMKCDDAWVRAVFTEEHWAKEEPMNPPRCEAWALQESFGLGVKEARVLEVMDGLAKILMEAVQGRDDEETRRVKYIFGGLGSWTNDPAK